MESSSREINDQLRAGRVSKEAFQRLWDAECYGNVSSLGALKSWLLELERALHAGRRIEVEGDRIISSLPELLAWIGEKFPEAYACFYEDKKPNQPPEPTR